MKKLGLSCDVCPFQCFRRGSHVKLHIIYKIIEFKFPPLSMMSMISNNFRVGDTGIQRNIWVRDQRLVTNTSSIMGPRASLSMTPGPVDETSAFCTSSASATGAFSATRNTWRQESKKTWKIISFRVFLLSRIHLYLRGVQCISQKFRKCITHWIVIHF